MDVKFWQRHGIRPTACRMAVLKALVDSRKAMSEKELRDAIGVEFDRTTFYRTVRSLQTVGLVHRIVVEHGFVKYAAHMHTGLLPTHAHFVCKQCEAVFCLQGSVDLRVTVPEGAKAEEEEVVVRGLCPKCASAK